MPDFSAAPINYSQDVASPFQAAMQGYQAGSAIRTDQLQQQQQQIAIQQQQAQMQALGALANNPNANGNDYARVMTAMPQLAEPLAKAWSTKNDAQQQSQISNLLQWGSAIKSGNPQVAASQMNARADAIEQANGGPTADSQALRTNASVVVAHPNFAYGLIQAQLAANPKAQTAAQTLASLGGEDRSEQLQPAAVAKARADASTAQSDATIKGVAAGNAPTATGLANQNATEDILDKQNQRNVADAGVGVAQSNAMTERGRLDLENRKNDTEQKLLVQQRGNAAQDGMDSLSQIISTAKQALEHPALNSPFGTGTLAGRGIPGTVPYDYNALIQSLKSESTMGQLAAMKAAGGGSTGLGRITQGEVNLIGSSIGNLDTSQSTDQQKAMLQKIVDNATRSQQKLVANNPSLPTKGGVQVMAHPTYGPVTEGDVNRLMLQNPGATRAQVLQYLQQSGSK